MNRPAQPESFQLPALSQRQVLTPSLRQKIKLLSATQTELSQILNRELQTNPLLEDVNDQFQAGLREQEKLDHEQAEPDPVSQTEQVNGLDLGHSIGESPSSTYAWAESERVEERPPFEQLHSRPATLSDYLNWQLSLSNVASHLRRIAQYIIGNLDENGYLSVTLEEISDRLRVPGEDVNRALDAVQSFDPVGVGCRDLRECLLLQARSFGDEDSLAVTLIRDHLQLVATDNSREIMKLLGIQSDELSHALRIIRGYSPRPGQEFSVTDPVYIQPDVFIMKVGNDYQIILNNTLPTLKISQSYKSMLRQKKVSTTTKNFIRERLHSAIEFLHSLDQRNTLISKVCHVIVRRQREVLESGITRLKPLLLQDVANELEVHPSTISRIVANKYAYTPYGMIRLRHFFASGGVSSGNGKIVSNMHVMARISKLIANEDSSRPLSDRRLADALNQSGIRIAVRTIAKYRNQMKIPSSFARKNAST